MELCFGWVLAQSRRGMKELDLILEKFNRNQYHKMNSAQKKIYHQFLKEEDFLLWNWFFDLAPMPQKYANLLQTIKQKPDHHSA